jgi:hypothetical protein
MYNDLVLEYKNDPKNTGNIYNITNDFFLGKYFKNNNPDIKFKPPFIPGEIYSFNYQTDSKITERRPFIDRMPLVICTDVFETKESGLIIKGIDIITVPLRTRVDILSKIYDNFAEQIKNNDASYTKGGSRSPINLKDKILVNLLRDTGYNESLFGFKTRFIKNVKVIGSSDWTKIPYLTVNFIEGLNVQEIYKQYQSKLI